MIGAANPRIRQTVSRTAGVSGRKRGERGVRGVVAVVAGVASISVGGGVWTPGLEVTLARRRSPSLRESARARVLMERAQETAQGF